MRLVETGRPPGVSVFPQSDPDENASLNESMNWHHFLILFFQGLVVSILLTPLMRTLAPKFGFLDQPGHRKVHHAPKPLLGGAAIFLSFMTILWIDLMILKWVYAWGVSGENVLIRDLTQLADFASGVQTVQLELMGLVGGGTLLFITGLVDDRIGLSPAFKLGAQVVAAVVLYMCNIKIALFVQYPAIQFLLTIFWVILITNAFNLLDNMDGLSGGVAMIALILLGVATHIVDEQNFKSALSFLLAGCIAGFLRYNINPSSIFMGDAGSLFTGFFVGALTILSTFYREDAPNSTSWAVVMPAVILAVPIFDTLSVILIRIKNGNPIYVGDKNHFSHRLVALGMSHRRAVFFIHLTTLCVGSSALILPLIEPAGAYVVLMQTIIFFILIAMLEYIKKKNHHADDKRGG